MTNRFEVPFEKIPNSGERAFLKLEIKLSHYLTLRLNFMQSMTVVLIRAHRYLVDV